MWSPACACTESSPSPGLAHYPASGDGGGRPSSPACSVTLRYGMERYLRGFLDLLTVTFMGRYRYRPLHLFGGLGLFLGGVGLVTLVYLTVLKVAGQAIGHRPLLTLGVLLVVVGMQFLSLGLLSELTEPPRGTARRRTARHALADVLVGALPSSTRQVRARYPRNAQVI